MKFSREIIDYILKNEHVDPYALALKKSPFPDVDMKVIARQIQGRKIARKKFRFLLKVDQYIYPRKESLEQASSEKTALYKSGLLEGKSFVDLTGGMGIDTYLMGKRFEECTYLEPNEALFKATKQNFEHLGFDQCETQNITCEEFLKTNKKKFDWAYIDPSRRIGGSRKISIHNYEPNVVELQSDLIKLADNILIKLSPMQSSPIIAAIDIGKTINTEYSYSFEDRVCSPELGEARDYLYQPNASIVKAEMQNRYARELGLAKLHANTNLYTSDQKMENFLGRIFLVEEHIKLNKKALRKIFPEMRANVIAKNYPLNAKEIARKFGIKPGDEEYLIAYTDHTGNKRVVKAIQI